MTRFLPAILGLCILACAAPASAQQTPRYVVGAGLDVTGSPGVSGLHIMGARRFSTRFAQVHGRLEGLLYSEQELQTALLASANLVYDLYDGPTTRPYLIGGAGLHLGEPGWLAANIGTGAELLGWGRPVLVEFRMHIFGSTSQQRGTFTLSLGTVW